MFCIIRDIKPICERLNFSSLVGAAFLIVTAVTIIAL
jgi:hypothetical protein